MSKEYELDTYINDTILKRWSDVRRKIHEVSNFILQYHIVRRMEHSKIVPLEIAIQMFVLNFFVQHAEAPLILRRKEGDKLWCLDQCEDIFDSIREALVFLEGFEKVSRSDCSTTRVKSKIVELGVAASLVLRLRGSYPKQVLHE